MISCADWMERSTTLKPGRRLRPQLNAIFHVKRAGFVKEHTSVAGSTFALGKRNSNS
jgi:hypothetical protein